MGPGMPLPALSEMEVVSPSRRRASPLRWVGRAPPSPLDHGLGPRSRALGARRRAGTGRDEGRARRGRAAPLLGARPAGGRDRLGGGRHDARVGRRRGRGARPGRGARARPPRARCLRSMSSCRTSSAVRPTRYPRFQRRETSASSGERAPSECPSSFCPRGGVASVAYFADGRDRPHPVSAQLEPYGHERDPALRGIEAELPDGGKALREFATNRGFELVIVESSMTSCTIRAARAPADAHALTVTYTAEDVHRAELDGHPDWRADPQRFLAAWATRDAAGWRLADVVLDLEEERLLRPLGVKPLGLHATSAERLDHARELTVALDAHRQRRTWSGALRQRFRRVARHPIWRLTENRRAPRRRPRATRRARTRSPDPDRSDLSSRRLGGARAGERHSSFARIGYPPSRRWLNRHVACRRRRSPRASPAAPARLRYPQRRPRACR